MRQKVEFYEQIIQHEEKYFLWYHTTEAESDRSSRTSEGSSGINDDYYFRRQKSIRKGQLPVAAQIDHSNRTINALCNVESNKLINIAIISSVHKLGGSGIKNLIIYNLPKIETTEKPFSIDNYIGAEQIV